MSTDSSEKYRLTRKNCEMLAAFVDHSQINKMQLNE